MVSVRQKLSKKIGNKHKLLLKKVEKRANFGLFVNFTDFRQAKNKFEHKKNTLQSSRKNWPDPELTLSHVSNITGIRYFLTPVT